jgi:hypothetical protein
MVVPGTGIGALSHIRNSSSSNIVSPPTDWAHCVGAAKVVVMEKGTASVEYAIVVVAAAISKECERKECEKNNNESV